MGKQLESNIMIACLFSIPKHAAQNGTKDHCRNDHGQRLSGTHIVNTVCAQHRDEDRRHKSGNAHQNSHDHDPDHRFDKYDQPGQDL